MPSARPATRGLTMPNLTLLIGSFILILIHGSLGQDFVFPGDRPSPARRPTKSTTTTTTPSTLVEAIQCPANMTLTKEPGEEESYCECIAGNLYYPKLDSCFLQFTRGPCKERQHLILPRNATVAKCVLNPCQVKDTVMFKGSCYPLYVTGGPCDNDKTLTIPETAHEPKCVKITTQLNQVITAPVRSCEPGSRRTIRGMCRKILR